MQLIDGPTRAAARPAPLATGAGGASPGWFAQPDLIAGIPPTIPTPDWCNGIQGELKSVIEAAGVTLDKASITNLLTALQTLFVAAGGGSGVHIGSTQCSLPLAGGFILKIGEVTGSYTEQSLAVVFDTAFPTKCWVALPIVLNSSAGNVRDVWGQIVSRATTGFTAFLQRSGGTGNTDSNDGIVWIAIGN